MGRRTYAFAVPCVSIVTQHSFIKIHVLPHKLRRTKTTTTTSECMEEKRIGREIPFCYVAISSIKEKSRNGWPVRRGQDIPSVGLWAKGKKNKKGCPCSDMNLLGDLIIETKIMHPQLLYMNTSSCNWQQPRCLKPNHCGRCWDRALAWQWLDPSTAATARQFCGEKLRNPAVSSNCNLPSLLLFAALVVSPLSLFSYYIF